MWSLLYHRLLQALPASRMILCVSITRMVEILTPDKKPSRITDRDNVAQRLWQSTPPGICSRSIYSIQCEYHQPYPVLGPQTFDSETKKNLNTFRDLVIKILRNGRDQEKAPSALDAVDGRDIAGARLVAFENPDGVRKQLLFNCDRLNAQSIVDILNESMLELICKIPHVILESEKQDIEMLC